MKKKILSLILMVCFMLPVMFALSACKEKNGDDLPEMSEKNYNVLKQAIVLAQDCDSFSYTENYKESNTRKTSRISVTPNCYMEESTRNGVESGYAYIQESPTDKIKKYNWNEENENTWCYLYEEVSTHSNWITVFNDKSLFNEINWSDGCSVLRFAVSYSTKKQFETYFNGIFSKYNSSYEEKNNKKYYYFDATYTESSSTSYYNWSVVLDSKNRVVEQNVVMGYKSDTETNLEDIHIKATIDYNTNNFSDLPDLSFAREYVTVGDLFDVLDFDFDQYNIKYTYTYGGNTIELSNTYSNITLYAYSSTDFIGCYTDICDYYDIKDDGSISYNSADSQAFTAYLPNAVKYEKQENGDVKWYTSPTEYITITKVQI